MSNLDFDREATLTIDSKRSITVTPTKDGATLTMLMEDPEAITVVELTRPEVAVLIGVLAKAIEP